MSKRNPPARYTLPLVLNPTSHKCFVINVPNDIYHIAAFRGQMEALAHAYAWHNDAGHTAKDVAQVWRSVLDGMETCMPALQFRQPSDCVLEVSSDGGASWDVIYSGYACASGAIDDALASGTIPNPAQPPAGGTIAADVCRTYHVVLQGRDIWHLPSPVSEGFNITVSNVRGGWSDGVAGGVTWQCPDGHIYALGICQSLEVAAETGDPLQSVNHMRLIGHVSEYFDTYAGTYVVPNGVTDAELTFQANDGTLSDNYGSIEFDVEVCNYGEWRHDFDFTTGQHGWTAYSGRASYVSGDGWHAVAADSTANWLFLILNADISFTISGIDMVLSVDNCNGGSADLVRAKTGVDWSGTQLFTYDPGIGNGGTVDHREYGQAIGPYTGARCLLYALSAQLGHTNTLHSFRIYGKGVKPNFT